MNDSATDWRKTVGGPIGVFGDEPPVRPTAFIAMPTASESPIDITAVAMAIAVAVAVMASADNASGAR